MKKLQRYKKDLAKWILAVLCLAPALGWAHGALDYPVSRAVNCQVTGGFWQSEDGSSIVDRGCREASSIFNTAAERAYPFQQWNEVAHIPMIHHPTLAQIMGIIKDGQICAANDPKKASLDRPTPYWTKTPVTPGQSLTLRQIGTAPHVPSTYYVFITKPGFNSATTPLTWNDLVPLGAPENLTVAQTNWQTPPKVPGATGYFEIVRPIPSGLTGSGLIVGIWVRDDPAGEFFISCSDVSFQGGSVPGQFYNIGAFIDADMSTLKAGDSVHFRIFDSKGANKELVDINHKITPTNLAPGQWGGEIARLVSPSVAKIGERANGENGDILFNQANPLLNSTFVTQPDYTQAMSIIPGGGTTPVNPGAPQARITGPDTLTSGQAFTFSGTSSSSNNGPLLYFWAVPGATSSPDASTISGKAPTVTQPTTYTARLNVRDPDNGKTSQATKDYSVTPGSGGQYDPYVQRGEHKQGTIYTHNGELYKCVIAPWCDGDPMYYEPGKGLAWQQAWEKQ